MNFRTIATALVTTVLAITAHGQTLISNGGFESGATDWTFSGANSSSGITGGSHSGSYSAYINFFDLAPSVSQSLSTTPGQSYQVAFWLSNNGYFHGDVTVSFGGTTGFSQTITETDIVSSFYYFDFVAPAASASSTFEFAAHNMTGGTVFIDDISVTAVPEPSTYAFLGGMVVLGLAVWRRGRNVGANAVD
jgi:hypothetical protein